MFLPTAWLVRPARQPEVAHPPAARLLCGGVDAVGRVPIGQRRDAALLTQSWPARMAALGGGALVRPLVGRCSEGGEADPHVEVGRKAPPRSGHGDPLRVATSASRRSDPGRAARARRLCWHRAQPEHRQAGRWPGATAGASPRGVPRAHAGLARLHLHQRPRLRARPPVQHERAAAPHQPRGRPRRVRQQPRHGGPGVDGSEAYSKARFTLCPWGDTLTRRASSTP